MYSVVCFVNTYPLACVAGGICKRASGAAIVPRARSRGNSRATNSTFHQSSHGFATRVLGFATKTKHSREKDSYAGYYPLDSNISGRYHYPAFELLGPGFEVASVSGFSYSQGRRRKHPAKNSFPTISLLAFSQS